MLCWAVLLTGICAILLAFTQSLAYFIIFFCIARLNFAGPFDLGIYEQGASRSVTFDNPGLVKVHCNIHPDMAAYVLALNNPHFAVTDRDGLFVIPDVPDGVYQLRTWHEFGGDTKQSLSVAQNSLHRVDLEIQEDRRYVGHRNKYGKKYKKGRY